MNEALFVNAHSQESAVDSVVNRFRDLIMQRKLKPGDQIPNESVLAEGMGVSRGSVREAMKILAALGVVEIRRGNGTYISEDIGRSMLDPFLLRLMMNDYNSRQMAEFREMIELDVARAILRNQSAQGIRAMEEAIGRMEKAPAEEAMEEERWAELDLAFHLAMGKATGNVLIEQLYAFILRFFEPTIRQTYRHAGNRAHALAIHRQIYNAAAAGDEKALLDAVKMSIEEWIIQGE